MTVDTTEPLVGVVLPDGSWTPEEAADYVIDSYRRTVEAVIETGRRLVESKDRLGHGNWLPFVELLPFSEQTARKLMAIAEHPDVSNRAHVRDLPASWGTLAVLAQLPAGELPALIEDGQITPDTTRVQAQQIVEQYLAGMYELVKHWSNAVDTLRASIAYFKGGYTPPPADQITTTPAEFTRLAKELVALSEEGERRWTEASSSEPPS